MKLVSLLLAGLLTKGIAVRAQQLSNLSGAPIDSTQVPVRMALRTVAPGSSEVTWRRVRLALNEIPDTLAYRAHFWQGNHEGFALLTASGTVLISQTLVKLTEVPTAARSIMQSQARRLEREFKRVDVEVETLRQLATSTYEATFYIPAEEANSWTLYSTLLLDAKGRKVKAVADEQE